MHSRRASVGIRVVILAILAIATVTACDFSTARKSHSDNSTAAQPKTDSDESIMTKHPHYELIRSYKNAHALELMKKYAAHSIGIRWKSNNRNTREELALAFYVSQIPSVGSASGALQIPEVIEIPDPGSGSSVSIPTEVIVSDQSSPE